MQLRFQALRPLARHEPQRARVGQRFPVQIGEQGRAASSSLRKSLQ
jgi:hypothetical protein